MPTYHISLDRTREHLASFNLEAPDILRAHAAAQTVKMQVLAKEKKDSFGNPKIADDICISTVLVPDV